MSQNLMCQVFLLKKVSMNSNLGRPLKTGLMSLLVLYLVLFVARLLYGQCRRRNCAQSLHRKSVCFTDLLHVKNSRYLPIEITCCTCYPRQDSMRMLRAMWFTRLNVGRYDWVNLTSESSTFPVKAMSGLMSSQDGRVRARQGPSYAYL